MSDPIVTSGQTVVNPFDRFKAKVSVYAAKVQAESFKCYDNGDRFVAVVYSTPTVRLYARPNSLKILAKIGYNPTNAKTLEIS